MRRPIRPWMPVFGISLALLSLTGCAPLQRVGTVASQHVDTFVQSGGTLSDDIGRLGDDAARVADEAALSSSFDDLKAAVQRNAETLDRMRSSEFCALTMEAVFAEDTDDLVDMVRSRADEFAALAIEIESTIELLQTEPPERFAAAVSIKLIQELACK